MECTFRDLTNRRKLDDLADLVLETFGIETIWGYNVRNEFHARIAALSSAERENLINDLAAILKA